MANRPTFICLELLLVVVIGLSLGQEESLTLKLLYTNQQDSSTRYGQIRRYQAGQAPDKYLWWRAPEGGIEWVSAGLTHQLRGLSCMIAEAHMLQRTLVLPNFVHESPSHQKRHRYVVSRIEDMLDLVYLSRCTRMVLLSDRGFQMRYIHNSTVQHLARTVNVSVPTADLMNDPADLVIRVLRGQFAFGICGGKSRSMYLTHPTVSVCGCPYTECFKPAPRTVDAGKAIASAIGRFVSLHVRRGDQLKGANFLANVSHPAAIYRCIHPRVPHGTKLYIASNERKQSQREFFAPLARHYKLYFWEDFTDELMKHGIITTDFSSSCLSSGGSNCSHIAVPSIFTLYQVESMVFSFASEHVEIIESTWGLQATDWWRQCAVQCVKANCTESPT